MIGGVALLGASLALRSLPARFAALAALLGAAIFLVMDYGLGWPAGQLALLNGRFLASVAVLGATGGVGGALTRRLARGGARVMAAGRDRARRASRSRDRGS